MLGFNVFYTALPLAWLSWSPLDLLATCYVLGAMMAGLLVANTALADHAAKQFDAGERVGGFQESKSREERKSRQDGQEDAASSAASGGAEGDVS